MKENGVLAKICIGLVVASFVGVFFVTSIMDLVNTRDLQTITLQQATDILTIEHSINGIIPTGKDYYYAGYNQDTKTVYAVHASKHWLTENFDANGNALQQGGYAVKGLVKRARSYEVEQELAARMSQMDGANQGFEYGRVLESNYMLDALLRLLAGSLILSIIVVGVLLKKKEDSVSLVARRVYIGAVVVVLLFSLAVIV